MFHVKHTNDSTCIQIKYNIQITTNASIKYTKKDIKCKYEVKRMENNVIITLRTNEEIKKTLDQLALKENRSLNNFIITILIEYIEKHKKNG